MDAHTNHSDDRPIVTERQVAEWRKEKSRLESMMSSTQAQLAEVSRKLEAVEILLGGPDKKSSAPEPESVSHPDVEATEPMTSAVERIAKQSPTPMTKKQVKKRLSEMGFPDARLGNYFYTVIARLKQQNKITVLNDGRLSSPSLQSNGSAG